MRKSILITFALCIMVGQSLIAQTRTEKAKAVIRTEFKNNMNDYASYQPVSYSKLDSLLTSPFEDEKFIKAWIDPTIKALVDLDIPSLEITDDVGPLIDAVKEDPSAYKENSLIKLQIFQTSQKLMFRMIDKYRAEFVGWKMVHKYRAKNEYNATVLYEDEFRFDKDITRVVSRKSVK